MSKKKILVWWKNNHPDETLELSQAWEQFKDKTDYQGQEKTFSNQLNRLSKKEKPLIEKPERGKYRLTEQGYIKAEYIENGEPRKGVSNDYKDLLDELTDYLAFEKDEEINQVKAKKQTFKVKMSELDAFNIELTEGFEKRPDDFLRALEEAAQRASDSRESIKYQLEIDVDYWDKPVVQARDSHNIGKPVTVKATIEKASEFLPEIVSATFECSQCAAIHDKAQETTTVKKPYKCDCGSKKFNLIEKEFENVIELRLGNQEGHNEYVKAVFRTDEIREEVNKVLKPGNQVKITGIGREEVRTHKGKKSKKVDPVLEIIDFTQQDRNKDLEDFKKEKVDQVKAKVDLLDNPFESFARSLAPHVVDADMAKKVFAAGLLGGPETEHRSDGRIHILNLSEPGLGKSDIQKFCKKTFANYYRADGRNATGVALTATVEQENGQYMLKAGKLVYANEGVLGLDEFDKMEPEEASRLNEAMTSKTFPVDKASINAELPGAATIIATGNFKQDSLDEFTRMSEQLPEHTASLMDRFDLVHAQTPPENQEAVQDAMLGSYAEKEAKFDAEFDQEELVIYRQLARDVDPVLSEEAMNGLKKWLSGQETIADVKGDRTFSNRSNRYINTLAKLTTMFARSRLSEKANMQDVEAAVGLFMACKSSTQGLYVTEEREEEQLNPEVRADG